MVTKFNYPIKRLGICVRPDVFYNFVAAESVHLTSVTLDTQLKSKNLDVQLWIKQDNVEQLIAMVTKQMPHVLINMRLSVGEMVSFFVRGTGSVYINGFIAERQKNDSVAHEEIIITNSKSMTNDQLSTQVVRFKFYFNNNLSIIYSNYFFSSLLF